MDAAAVTSSKLVASERLLAHCFAFDSADTRRPAATERLDALLGSELARRLVAALSQLR